MGDIVVVGGGLHRLPQSRLSLHLALKGLQLIEGDGCTLS